MRIERKQTTLRLCLIPFFTIFSQARLIICFYLLKTSLKNNMQYWFFAFGKVTWCESHLKQSLLVETKCVKSEKKKLYYFFVIVYLKK